MPLFQCDLPQFRVFNDDLLLVLDTIFGQKVIFELEVRYLIIVGDDNDTLISLWNDHVHERVWCSSHNFILEKLQNRLFYWLGMELYCSFVALQRLYGRVVEFIEKVGAQVSCLMKPNAKWVIDGC